MPAKNENHLQSVQKDAGTGKTQGAFWLQILVTDAVDGKGFHTIEEYLQQKESHVPQKYDHLLLRHLEKLINEELDKNEFQNFSLLLKCIQRFLKGDEDQDEPLLIQQGLIPKMVSWFDTMMGFLITKILASDALLTKAMEDCLDIALIVCRQSRKGTIQLLDSFIFSLGFLAAEDTVKPCVQREALSTLNCILDAAPREEKRKFSSAEGTRRLMKEFARTILTVGDYSQQAALSEALCRMATRTLRDELAFQWFGDAVLAEAFKEIKNREFETMRKPADEKLQEFWIDFNLGSQSVTFYIDNAESALWETVRLSKEAVAKFSIMDNDRIKMLIIYLKQPLVISKREAMTIEIHFDRQLAISQASVQALGEDKQMPVLMKISSGHFSEFEKEDGEIPSSNVIGTGHAEESTVLPGSVDAEDDRCLITRCFDVQSEPAQTNTEDPSPEKSKSDDPKREVTSKPENPSDAQEPSTQTQAPELNDTKEDWALERNRKQDRKIRFNYREHLFSESNEDSSSSTGEPFWIWTPKQKSLRSYSQRRQLRVSSLKILPLSPVSDGNTREKDQAKLRPGWKGFSRQNDSTLPRSSETKPQELRSPHSSVSLSSSEPTEVEESVPQIVNQEALMENSFKHKLENLEHRETPDGSIAAPKQSRLEEDAPGSPVLTDISPLSREDVLEDANSSALTVAFENFTRDLKRKFELKQKESPLSSEKAKEAPDCLRRLWNQIYTFRLNKLENFHSFVLQELSNLEKDLQALECLEKDVLEFWKKQSADLQSFCDQQALRNMGESLFPGAQTPGLTQLSLCKKAKAWLDDCTHQVQQPEESVVSWTKSFLAVLQSYAQQQTTPSSC